MAGAPSVRVAAVCAALRGAATAPALAGVVSRHVLSGRDYESLPGQQKVYVRPAEWPAVRDHLAEALAKLGDAAVWVDDPTTRAQLVGGVADVCGHRAAGARWGGRGRGAVDGLVAAAEAWVGRELPSLDLARFADACVHATGALPGYLAALLRDGAVLRLDDLSLLAVLRWALVLIEVQAQHVAVGAAGAAALEGPCSHHDAFAPPAQAPPAAPGSALCIECVIQRVAVLFEGLKGAPAGPAERRAQAIKNALLLTKAVKKLEARAPHRTGAPARGPPAPHLQTLVARMVRAVAGYLPTEPAVAELLRGEPVVLVSLSKALLSHDVATPVGGAALAAVLQPRREGHRRQHRLQPLALPEAVVVAVAAGEYSLKKTPWTDAVVASLYAALSRREQGLHVAANEAAAPDRDLVPLLHLLRPRHPPPFLDGAAAAFLAGDGGSVACDMLRELVVVLNTPSVTARIADPSSAVRILRRLPPRLVSRPLRTHCVGVLARAAAATPLPLDRLMKHLTGIAAHLRPPGAAGDAEGAAVRAVNAAVIRALGAASPAEAQRAREPLVKVFIAQRRVGINDPELAAVLRSWAGAGRAVQQKSPAPKPDEGDRTGLGKTVAQQGAAASTSRRPPAATPAAGHGDALLKAVAQEGIAGAPSSRHPARRAPPRPAPEVVRDVRLRAGPVRRYPPQPPFVIEHDRLRLQRQGAEGPRKEQGSRPCGAETQRSVKNPAQAAHRKKCKGPKASSM